MGAVIYNENKGIVRTISNSTKYEFQEGEYYIRFGFAGESQKFYANYGNTNYGYTPYKKRIPELEEVESKVSILENDNEDIKQELTKKLDNIFTDNLINPSLIRPTYYINGNGDISGGGGTSFGVTDYILINQQNIISNCLAANYAGSYIVYDENKNYIRHTFNNTKYTY